LVGIIRYAPGTCGVCNHPESRTISGILAVGKHRMKVLRKYPDLTHHDINMHRREIAQRKGAGRA
jgi:hypothetical protein